MMFPELPVSVILYVSLISESSQTLILKLLLLLFFPSFSFWYSNHSHVTLFESVPQFLYVLSIFFFFSFQCFFSLHLRMESFSWFIFKLTYSLLHCELHNCLSSDRAPQSASNSHCLPCLQPSLSISLKPWPQLSIFFLPLFDSARVEWAGWEKFTSSSYSRTLTNSFPFQSIFFFF